MRRQRLNPLGGVCALAVGGAALTAAQAQALAAEEQELRRRFEAARADALAASLADETYPRTRAVPDDPNVIVLSGVDSMAAGGWVRVTVAAGATEGLRPIRPHPANRAERRAARRAR